MDIEALWNIYNSCNGVVTDSRRASAGGLFVGLKGCNFNGSEFAASALQSGCQYAVIDDARYMDSSDSRYILVDNSLEVLQNLARHHRRKMDATVIGITGTNGKTTTKELMYAVLSSAYGTLATEGNLNNSIGVPLTLLKLKPSHKFAIIEMGASHPGDIKELVDICEPSYGLITNVGMAHLQGFGSFEGVLRTKCELYDWLRSRAGGAAFVNAADSSLFPASEGLVRYFYEKSGAVQGKALFCDPYLTLSWQEPESCGEHTLHTHLVGDYNLHNVLAAITVGLHFGVPAENINRAIEAYVPKNNRSQLVETPLGNTLVADAYNANPTSMRAAVENFARIRTGKEKYLVLGSMLELGEAGEREHETIVRLVQDLGLEHVFYVGKEFRAACSGVAPCFDTVGDLMAELAERPLKDACILIKGSNGIRLNELVNAL